jgi:aryl-alcohol dehydrogenase-like predicted oxidoreductase
MAEQQLDQRIQLGKSGVWIPPIGTGCWQWGDRIFWGFGRGYSDTDVKDSFDVSLASGINFFDTAEVYGNGTSERLLGSFAEGADQPLIIATKFMPYPWRLLASSLPHALERSLKRLKMQKVELYQIHMAMPPMPVQYWVKELIGVVGIGLCSAVGVSNYNAGQTRRAAAVLTSEGVPLASNQVEYSLLDRSIERNGVLDTCQELGVTVIAYSPLAKGALTGKYTPDNIPPGLRGRQYNPALLRRVQPLIRLMRDIGHSHEGKSPAQVALNWLMCKGVVPIPGAKNARQAKENTGALGWRLAEGEVEALDEASKDF